LSESQRGLLSNPLERRFRIDSLRYVARWKFLLVGRTCHLLGGTALDLRLKSVIDVFSGETGIKLREEEVCEDERKAKGDDNSVVLFDALSATRITRR